MNKNNNMNKETNFSQQTFHRYHASLLSAVAEVASVSVLWKQPTSEEKINIYQLEALARENDQEQPLKEGEGFYIVSPEGAIGYCPGGVEYLTRWLFYPCMDEESVREFVEDIYRKLEEIKAEDEAAARAEAEAKAAAEEEAEKAAEQPASAPAAKFCPNCGTPYEEGARFCMKCGTPRQ